MSEDEARYKVVEVSPVVEETLERALNDRSREGWAFESLHFVTRDGSHRPALAYLFFVRGKARGRGSVGREGGRRDRGGSPGGAKT